MSIFFPDIDLASLRDLETGEIRTVDTGIPSLQQQMCMQETKRLADLKARDRNFNAFF